MNAMTSQVSSRLILEVAADDLDWSVQFLSGFEQWLIAGGFSAGSIQQHYLRVAKWLVISIPRLQPEDSPEAIVLLIRGRIETRGDLIPWRKREAYAVLGKLREYLYFQHKMAWPAPDPLALPKGLSNLPAWIHEPLSRFIRLKQRNWPIHSVLLQTRNLFHRLEHLITFFVQRCGWLEWGQLSVRWVDDYLDDGLRRGLSASTLNGELFALMGWCHFLRQEGFLVANTMTQLKPLAQPDRLPRPLSDEQVRRVERCIQMAIEQAPTPYRRQQAIMDQAWFYLLWHCGLRLGEVLRLTLADIDLAGSKLLVRVSKERKDRVVYVSSTACQALQRHFETRPDRTAG